MLRPMPDASRMMTEDLFRIAVDDLFVELAQELDNKTDDIKKLAYEISTKLKSRFLSVEENQTLTLCSALFVLGLEHAQEQHSDQERSTAQGRIKESQIFVVTRRFRDMMNQYNHEFLHHRDKCKKAISHELEICECRMAFDFDCCLSLYSGQSTDRQWIRRYAREWLSRDI